MSGDFEFENMTVAYKDGPNILDNINLEIKDGEKVRMEEASKKNKLFRNLRACGETKILISGWHHWKNGCREDNASGRPLPDHSTKKW